MKNGEDITGQQAASSNTSRGGKLSRWVVFAGVLLLGGIFAALPDHITLGLGWVPLTIGVLGTLAIVLIQRKRRLLSPYLTRLLSLIMLVVFTLALIGAIILMMHSLSDTSQSQARMLLRTAGLLWCANILVFAFWYWEIDGGGPTQRREKGHRATHFRFPQPADGDTGSWAPHFLDYLFVAFTSATAFGPTDTSPLSRRAKMLMMTEATISLLTMSVLIGRALNIL